LAPRWRQILRNMLFINVFYPKRRSRRVSFDSLKRVAFTHLACILFSLIPAIMYAQGNSLNFSIDQCGASGIASLTEPPIPQPPQVFHARLQASAVPSAYACLRYNVSFNRQSAVHFPLGPAVQSGRIYAEVGDAAKVGVAISNESDHAASVQFYLTDAQGANVGGGTTTIPANGQIARFLDQDPFDAPNPFIGTLTFTSDTPVGVVAVRGDINENLNFLMPYVPVVALGETASPILPYFSDGGGSRTDVILVNPSDQALAGSIQFWSQGDATAPAALVNVTIAGQSANTFPYSILPRSAVRFSTAGDSANAQLGSINMVPAQNSAAPSGFAIVSSISQGIITSQRTIRAARLGNAFRLYANGFRIGITMSRGERTFFAVANPSASPISINIQLTTTTPSPLPMPTLTLTRTLTIPANGEILSYLEDTFGDQNGNVRNGSYFGVIRITSASPISVVGFDELLGVTGPSGLEAVDESAPPVGNRVVPHLVSAGGYEPSVILFKGSDSQSASGNAQFFSQDGSPFDPTTVGFQ